MLTASAVVADAHYRGIVRHLGNALRELPQRNRQRTFDPAKCELPGLAHVEQHRGCTPGVVAPARKLGSRKLGNQNANREGVGALCKGAMTVSKRSSAVNDPSATHRVMRAVITGGSPMTAKSRPPG